MAKLQYVPTAMGLAFINAAARAIQSAKVPEPVKVEPAKVPQTQKERAEAETARLRKMLHPAPKVQPHSTEKVDHAPWVARRIALSQSHAGFTLERFHKPLPESPFQIMKAKGLI